MNNQTTKVKSKNKGAVVVLALIVAIILSMYAYSKYTSTLTGNGTSTVAKWSFKVNGQTQTIPDIELGETMDAHNNVVTPKLAPGTSGHFDLILDGSGSEVAIDYNIKLAITQKPTNLKFYLDDKYQTPISETDGTLNIAGSIALEDVNTPLTKTIYWQWPYETGKTSNEIDKNDETDTKDSGKNVTMTITVTGTQRDPKSGAPEQEVKTQRLADVVSVGDKVNYDASSGETKTYTTEESLTGSSTTATFNSSDAMTWKVMSVDKTTGIVELMAENPTAKKVALYGKAGYKNAVTVLDKVGDVYGHGKGATGGRSITIEDVNKLENYTPKDDTTTSYTYTSGTFINDDGTETEASESNQVTLKYTASTQSKSTNRAYNYSTKNLKTSGFWLASPCINLHSNYCDFCVRSVDSGSVDNYFLFYSRGDEYGFDFSVVPVVSLKSNIQTSGKTESGEWNLVVE
jgi:hypothetical protein